MVVPNAASAALTAPGCRASIGNTPIVTAAEAGLPESLRFSDKNNFMPRLGFAYRPFSNDNTVVRGGFGMFNTPSLGSIFYALTGTLQSDTRQFLNIDANGNPLQCRASTRKGTPCQRMPLPHNRYCPSHQHLAETEELPAPVAA